MSATVMSPALISLSNDSGALNEMSAPESFSCRLCMKSMNVELPK